MSRVVDPLQIVRVVRFLVIRATWVRARASSCQSSLATCSIGDGTGDGLGRCRRDDGESGFPPLGNALYQ
jgi:hypothetical protein